MIILVPSYSQKIHKFFSPPVAVTVFMRKSHVTVVPHITQQKQCVLTIYPQAQKNNIPVFFLIHEKQEQPFKAVILVQTLQ